MFLPARKRILAITFIGHVEVKCVCAECAYLLRLPLREQQLTDSLEKGVWSLGSCGCPTPPEPGLGRKLDKNDSNTLILSTALVVSQLK